MTQEERDDIIVTIRDLYRHQASYRVRLLLKERKLDLYSLLKQTILPTQPEPTQPEPTQPEPTQPDVTAINQSIPAINPRLPQEELRKIISSEAPFVPLIRQILSDPSFDGTGGPLKKPADGMRILRDFASSPEEATLKHIDNSGQRKLIIAVFRAYDAHLNSLNDTLDDLFPATG